MLVLIVIAQLLTGVRPHAPSRILTRRIALGGSLSQGVFLVGPCFGFKGTFYETGNMVYEKQEIDPEEGLDEFRKLIEVLSDAKQAAEAGDTTALRNTLQIATERKLRLYAAPLLTLTETEDNFDDGFKARDAFRNAINAYNTLDRSLSVREAGNAPPVLSQVATALTASGLIFLLPPAAVNSALDRTPQQRGSASAIDSGLVVLGALDDCVRAADLFIKLVAPLVLTSK